MSLHLHLSVTELLIKLLKVRPGLNHQCLIRNVPQRFLDDFIESTSLLYQLLLHSEQVPVFPN